MNTSSDLDQLFEPTPSQDGWLAGSYIAQVFGRSKYDNLLRWIAQAVTYEGVYDSRAFDLAFTTHEILYASERMLKLGDAFPIFRGFLFQKIRVPTELDSHHYFIVMNREFDDCDA